jgi:hypothetical protein
MAPAGNPKIEAQNPKHRIQKGFKFRVLDFDFLLKSKDFVIHFLLNFGGCLFSPPPAILIAG